MRAVIYARVSSKEKQGDNFSIPSQLEALRQQAGRSGYQVVRELTETASAYQDGLERSELGKAMELARARQVDALFFFSTDRFTRDMADGVVLRRELVKLGVKLYCCSPHFKEVTSEMELLNVLTDWQAQEYVTKLREASMRGYANKAQQGLFAAGNAPYGYQLVGKKTESHLELVDGQWQIVVQIFTWFVVDGLGTVVIARRLTEAAIPTPSDVRGARRLRPPGQWTYDAVYHILSNDTYSGTWFALRWRRLSKRKCVTRPADEQIAVPVPAIVDRAMWEAAQQKIRARAHARNVKHAYLLRGRITCRCGYAATGITATTTAKPTSYYQCGGHSSARGHCGLPSFRCDAVDAVVWGFALDLLRDPTRMLSDYHAAQAQLDEQHAATRTQLALLDEQIAAFNSEQDEVIAMRKRATTERLKAKYDAEIERLEAVITDLDTRRAALTARLGAMTVAEADTRSVCDAIAALRAEIADLEVAIDFATQRRLIEALNLKIDLRVDDDAQKWVDIHWLLSTVSLSVNRTIRAYRRRCKSTRSGWPRS